MRIGFVLFDHVTQLDAMGPLQFLSRLPDVDAVTVAKTREPVSTDCPVSLVPTHGFSDIGSLDMVCVPGGFGVRDVLNDGEFMRWLSEACAGAEYVTSVCTGALLLGGAGLLRGKRATTHWAYTDLLKTCGAIYQPGRTVRDGNLFTGGGVTAGIDFALTIARDLHGEDVAQRLQLGLEYDPAPPVNAGSPRSAPSQTLASLKRFYRQPVAKTRAALERQLETLP